MYVSRVFKVTVTARLPFRATRILCSRLRPVTELLKFLPYSNNDEIQRLVAKQRHALFAHLCEIWHYSDKPL
jgi:hypothetical protein